MTSWPPARTRPRADPSPPHTHTFLYTNLPEQQVSLAIPTMQVQELNNEFNTPLDMVKVVVERHKPYHSAGITVEQRAFQVTEKVSSLRSRLAETL